MKRILLILFLSSSCLAQEPTVFIPVATTKPAPMSEARRKRIEQQLRDLNKDTKKELADTQREKGDLVAQLGGVKDELGQAQAAKLTLQTGIDHMRSWGVAWQERAQKAEVSLAKKDATILRFGIAFASLVLLNAIYFFLKFYMRLPL